MRNLERITESMAGINPGDIVTVGVNNNLTHIDELIVFIKYKKKDLKQFRMISNQIKQHIMIQIGLKVDYTIPTAKIPKTTSGKLQRYKLISEFRSGEFDSIIHELRRIEDDEIIP